MSEISKEMKAIFCGDCEIPIDVFEEPYFTDRINLYDKFYNTKNRWETFKKETWRYADEVDYINKVSEIVCDAVTNIMSANSYNRFIAQDISGYKIKNKSASKSIYSRGNGGKWFISMTMKDYVFNILREYDPSIFENVIDWKQYISRYTDNQHIINSKRIMQSILGECNQIYLVTYKKYLLDITLFELDKKYGVANRLVWFDGDEIIIDVSDMNESERNNLLKQMSMDKPFIHGVPIIFELFALGEIRNEKSYKNNGYIKYIISVDGSKRQELKNVETSIMPLVMRKISNEDIEECDRAFYSNGTLARYIEVPEIRIIGGVIE